MLDKDILKNDKKTNYGAGTNRNQKRKYVVNDDYIIK